MRMLRWASCLLAALCLFVLLPRVLRAGELTQSYTEEFKSYPKAKTFQLIRVDNSDSLSGTSPAGGEHASSGDYSKAADCTGAVRVQGYVREYGTGSIVVSFYNVVPTFGASSSVDPANSPTPSTPSPLSDVLTPIGGMDGNTPPYRLDFTTLTTSLIRARIDTCSGNCDSIIELVCVFP